jgi:hypothetical protein
MNGNGRIARLRRTFGSWTIVPLSSVLVAGVALTVLGLSPGIAGASSVNLYVSPSGADTSNCQTSSSPCATVGYALSQAAAGDAVLLASGTYKVSADPSGTSNTVGATLTGLTIESNSGSGANAANTFIDATGEANGLVVQANGVTVQGLTVENANLEGILVQPPPSTWPTSPRSVGPNRQTRSA